MISIRPATANDVEILSAFIHNSASEQDGLDDVVVSPANLLEDGFGPQPLFNALIAESDGIPAGFALYFSSYSTWTSRRGLFLEDLYVEPEFRRLGIARQIMAQLAQIAIESGGGCVNWLVLRNNAKATEFYRSLGAEMGVSWMPARLTGDALQSLAGKSST